MTRVANAPRLRKFAVAAVGAALLASTMTWAWADPSDQLRETEREIDQAKEELHHSTEELAEATEEFEKANKKLPGAKEKYRSAEDDLAAADNALGKAQDRLATARVNEGLAIDALAKAEQEVHDQEVRIAGVIEEIGGQREQISQLATSAYQRGSGSELAMLTSALAADSMSEFAKRLQMNKSVLESEGVILDRLQDSRAELANEQVVLKELKAEAEQLREEAAEHVAQMETRQAQAKTAKEKAADAAVVATAAKDEVEHLVAAREQAMGDAEAARAADEAAYEELKADREALQNEIDRIEQERRSGGSGSSDGSSGSGSSGGDSSSDPLVYPVANPYVTSPYGMRVHPVTGVYKLHDGTDFGAGCGVPIRAAHSGTVEWASYQGAYGNQVAVSGGNYVTTYSHLSSFAAWAGESVSQGEIIGHAGTTGSSTGCHLHFMLYVNGQLSDPMSYL